MEPVYKLLALDLDGTLTNSEKKISKRNRDAVWACIGQGVNIVLASGRPLIGIRPVAEQLELYQRGGYILAYNGGHIIDCRTGRTIHKKTLDKGMYHEICQAGKLFGVYPLTYDDESVLAEYDDNEYVRREAYNNGISIKKIENLESAVKNEAVKFMIVGEHDRLLGAKTYLEKIYGEQLNVFFSEPYFLEVMPAGIEKAQALQRLLSHLSVPREQMIACGDGLNDISMLEFAGVAVAMGNGCDDIKRAADLIVADNDEDGVAEAIDRLILQAAL